LTVEFLFFKSACFAQGEHSPFVTITINVATGWLFEHGYAKEAARYFQTAGNGFRTMLKKLPCRCMLKYQDKRGMPPHSRREGRQGSYIFPIGVTDEVKPMHKIFNRYE